MACNCKKNTPSATRQVTRDVTRPSSPKTKRIIQRVIR